jgi:hypothetical protein
MIQKGQHPFTAAIMGPPPVQACRICGCTDSTPYMTSAGPCCWVESDLCSGCEKTARASARKVA